MPSGQGQAVSNEQIEAIRTQVVESGLKARGILRLNLPILEGLKEGAIQRIICQEGLVDPVRSERFRKAPRLTREKKAEILAYLQGDGKNATDLAIARAMQVSKQSIYWLRLTRIGKVQGPPRVSLSVEMERRRKLALTYIKKRVELWKALYELQRRLEAEGCEAPLQECTVCGDVRFRLPDFFYRTRGGFSGMCRVCWSEMAALRHHGKEPDEIQWIMHCLIWQDPAKDAGQLIGQFRKDTSQHCDDPLFPCAVCKKLWYRNGNYFHAHGTNGNRTVLNICLACPVRRPKRKFYLPEGALPKGARARESVLVH